MRFLVSLWLADADGITLLSLSQPAFATKSALDGHGGPAEWPPWILEVRPAFDRAPKFSA